MPGYQHDPTAVEQTTAMWRTNYGTWGELLVWLTGDRECRSLTVDVRADDPSYDETDSDEKATWSFSYAIEAAEPWIFGGEEIDAAGGPNASGGSMSSVTYHGFGSSLNQAAAVVLAMIADHAKHTGGSQ